MSEQTVVHRRALGEQHAEVRLLDSATATYRLTVDGIPQSQVCLSDPTVVTFDYARHIARMIDAHGTAGEGQTFAHLGGGALTLVRYVIATRPGSTQYVIEAEEELTKDLLGILPLADDSDVRFLFGDARAIVEGCGPGTPWPAADVTVVDLWSGATIVARVASLEFYARLTTGMTGGGVIAVNILDGSSFTFARRQAATLSTLFDRVAVTMDHAMIDGSQMGNVLLFASNRALGALAEPGWPAGDANPPQVLTGAALREWIDGAEPMTDADATDSPSPGIEYDTRQ